MSDRRTEKRWEVCLDAVWDGNSGKHRARVTDLSEGGCYVDTLGDAMVGEVLNVTLRIPNGESLKLTGVVAHQMPPIGFGIRFVDLSSEQFEKLRSLLVDQQSPPNNNPAILSK